MVDINATRSPSRATHARTVSSICPLSAPLAHAIHTVRKVDCSQTDFTPTHAPARLRLSSHARIPARCDCSGSRNRLQARPAQSTVSEGERDASGEIVITSAQSSHPYVLMSTFNQCVLTRSRPSASPHHVSALQLRSYRLRPTRSSSRSDFAHRPMLVGPSMPEIRGINMLVMLSPGHLHADLYHSRSRMGSLCDL